VAWFHGRSEAGPRALGSRSIIADPRKIGMKSFINEHVKNREPFRPFAPSVLEEHASDWFESVSTNQVGGASPYMSLTTKVLPEKQTEIPAVTHIDGTSRLQTVSSVLSPRYHKLISTFYNFTGMPMVLNTSFNTLKGEPIVETPSDAIKSFLYSMGSIEMLVLGDFVIRRKEASVPNLLGKKTADGLVTEPACPKTMGPFIYESTCQYDDEYQGGEGIPPLKIRVRMPNRPMHNDDENDGWFELLDELEAEMLGLCDGMTTFQDMLERYYPAMKAESEAEEAKNPKGESKENDEQFDKVLLENLITRLTRLYEHTFVTW